MSTEPPSPGTGSTHRTPFLLTLALAVVFLSVLGAAWLHQSPSGMEMLAHVAKARDYLAGALSVGGIPWWTPQFLHGMSLAPAISDLGTGLWLLLWASLGGVFAGPKIAGLLCLLGGSLAMFAFARRLAGCGWAAAACALGYLLAPSLSVRLAGVEHMNFVVAFALLPLVFLGVLHLFECPSPLSGLICGMACAALILASVKAAALALPILVAFGVWAWIARGRGLPVAALLAAFVVTFLLGVLPNLPVLREVGFAAMFDNAPFAAWQQAFSTKSALFWLDRGRLFTQGMPDTAVPGASDGSYYLGVISLGVFIFLLLPARSLLYSDPIGRLCRVFLALSLLAFWFSFGPRSVLGGQLAFLGLAADAPEVSPALSWFLLFAQPWIIFRLIRPDLRARLPLGIGLSVIYLLVPGYRLLSWLPLYRYLVAPQDFYQFAGVFCAAMAGGLAVCLLLAKLPSPRLRGIGAAILLAAAVADLSVYLKPFFASPLEASTFDDFGKAGTFLATAPDAGSVYVLSGRYFYLLLPQLTGRALANEAFDNHLAQRGIGQIEAGAFLSEEMLRSSLRLAGIRYVLIDTTDPDTPAAIQDKFTAILPTVFENKHFKVLENRAALAPAYLAREFVLSSVDSRETASGGLMLGQYNLATIMAAGDGVGRDGQVGTLSADGLKLSPRYEKGSALPFERVELEVPRTANYQEIHLRAPGKKGWLILPEAFHPDWTAYAGLRPLQILPAFGAFLAVRVEDGAAPVVLKFEPPFWYPTCLSAALLAWIGISALALWATFSRADSRALGWLTGRGGSELPAERFAATEAGPNADRALVVIPTYNEAGNIITAIDAATAASAAADVLVVDDGSPDGTAGIVRGHGAFGTRVHVLERGAKLGLGTAYHDGFAWALARGYGVCIEMDADLSHDPADIPRLLEAIAAGADVAIGSRYIDGVRVLNWPQNRLFLSTGASKFVRLVTGLPLTDATSGFKAIRASAIRSLDWSRFKASGYGFQVELHYFLWEGGARLVEVPIIFTERRAGETKMSLGIAFEAAWRVISLGFGGLFKP